MSNTNRSPDQLVEDAQRGNRLHLVPFSAFSMKRGLLALYPGLAADLARRRTANQIGVRSVEQAAPAPVTPIPEAPAPSVAEVPAYPLSHEQVSQETARQQLLTDAYEKINKAHQS